MINSEDLVRGEEDKNSRASTHKSTNCSETSNRRGPRILIFSLGMLAHMLLMLGILRISNNWSKAVDSSVDSTVVIIRDVSIYWGVMGLVILLALRIRSSTNAKRMRADD